MKTSVVNLQLDAHEPERASSSAFRPQTVHSMYNRGFETTLQEKGMARPGSYATYDSNPAQRFVNLEISIQNERSAEATSGSHATRELMRFGYHRNVIENQPASLVASHAELPSIVASSGISVHASIEKSLPLLQNAKLLPEKPLFTEYCSAPQSSPIPQRPFEVSRKPPPVLSREGTVQNFALALPNESEVVHFESPLLAVPMSDRCDFFTENSSITTVDESTGEE